MSNDKDLTTDMEFETPPGLRPGAQLDARFPVSYQTSVPEAMRVMVEFFTGLSHRSMEDVAKTLHYPFAMYEDVAPVLVESEGDLLNNPPASINVTGRGETEVMTGSYDLLEKLELQTFSPVGAVLTMSFMRYTSDHTVVSITRSPGILVYRGGRWGMAGGPGNMMLHHDRSNSVG